MCRLRTNVLRHGAAVKPLHAGSCGAAARVCGGAAAWRHGTGHETIGTSARFRYEAATDTRRWAMTAKGKRLSGPRFRHRVARGGRAMRGARLPWSTQPLHDEPPAKRPQLVRDRGPSVGRFHGIIHPISVDRSDSSLNCDPGLIVA